MLTERPAACETLQTGTLVGLTDSGAQLLVLLDQTQIVLIYLFTVSAFSSMKRLTRYWCKTWLRYVEGDRSLELEGFTPQPQPLTV